MSAHRLLPLAAALLALSCRIGITSGPDVGPLDRVETVPVRLGVDTRPAVAGAEGGRCKIGVRLLPGHLVLSFGWRAAAAGSGLRALFRGRDGSERVLLAIELPPPEGGDAAWGESVVPVPAELVGRSGQLVFESDVDDDGTLFAGLPRLVRERGDRPNLILVSLDTLRADRLGAYGNRRPTSPSIDAMAAEGTRFHNAFSPASWTLPSHYTMMTSLYPSAHGVHPDTQALTGLDSGHETLNLRGSGQEKMLAERLAERGYYTAAITESGWVDARFGFDQGFASYIGQLEQGDVATGTGRLALDWLRAHRDLPFFLFVHTYSAHQPYHQPPPYDTMFLDPEHVGYALPGLPVPMATLDKFRHPFFSLMPADREAFRALYDGDIRYVDGFVGELAATLRAEGLDRDTVVLLTSDHGEELFEHGIFDHGGTLYDEVLRVPFVLWGPGRIPAGVVRQSPVGVVDVLPTLVELAGGEPPTDLQGHSLLPLLAAERADFAERPLYAEGFATVFHHRLEVDASVPLASVRLGAEKLVLHRSEPARAELFDLSTDPGESRDLAAERPQRAAELEQMLLAWLAGNEAIRDQLGGAAVELDAETRRRLRALGYL